MEDNKVIKDMADDYNARLSHYLDELDYLKEMSAGYLLDPNNNRPIVWRINQKLDQIFVHISEKINIANPEDVEKQNKYQTELLNIERKGLITFRKKQDPTTGDLNTFSRKSIYYLTYESKVRQREIELRAIMERLDLTNKNKKISKKYT